MMMADQTIIEQISNRKISLKIEGRIVMPTTISSDFLKTINQQSESHDGFILRPGQKIELLESKSFMDEMFLKQYKMWMQELATKYNLPKSDPIMDELLQESEVLLLEFGTLVMMMTGTNFQPGDIFYKMHTFPGQQPKERPVIVISKYVNNMSNDTFVCLPITRDPRTDPDKITLKNNKMQVGQMKHDPCYVVCDNAVALLQQNTTRKIGTVSPSFYQEIANKLKNNVLEIP